MHSLYDNELCIIFIHAYIRRIMEIQLAAKCLYAVYLPVHVMSTLLLQVIEWEWLYSLQSAYTNQNKLQYCC